MIGIVQHSALSSGSGVKNYNSPRDVECTRDDGEGAKIRKVNQQG